MTQLAHWDFGWIPRPQVLSPTVWLNRHPWRASRLLTWFGSFSFYLWRCLQAKIQVARAKTMDYQRLLGSTGQNLTYWDSSHEQPTGKSAEDVTDHPLICYTLPQASPAWEWLGGLHSQSCQPARGTVGSLVASVNRILLTFSAVKPTYFLNAKHDQKMSVKSTSRDI